MPRRKGHQPNKKKNKGGGGGRSSSGKGGSVTRNNKNDRLHSKSPTVTKYDPPSKLKEYQERYNKESADFLLKEEALPTMFSRYKAATKRFVEYMVDSVPESVQGNRKSVNFLYTAVDWMIISSENNDFVLDASILKDLKLAIRVRARVAKSFFGGGDGGHKHFLQVLQHCWQALLTLPRSKDETLGASKEKQAEATNKKRNENRFAAFLEEQENDDEVELDEEVFPSDPVPRNNNIEEGMTIEELLSTDERHDAILFLMTLDDLMGFVKQQYQVVTRNFRSNRGMGIPDSSIVEDLLEAAVTANMAIQQVQQLEAELALQYEHLTTPCRLLSTLVMPHVTLEVARIVREHGTTTPSGSDLEKEIIMFLGDNIECAMRSPSDPVNKPETILQTFCDKFQLDEEGFAGVQEMFGGTFGLVANEIPIGHGKTDVKASILAAARAMGRGDELPPSHSWFRDMKNIGGDRAIHHTLGLLQSFTTVMAKMPKGQVPQPKRGYFGPTPWQPGRTRKIHGDLDELFMADILPQWYLMCKQGIFGHLSTLPREQELCPLFVLLREYVQDPSKPVSWSLTFGAHALLAAVLETDSYSDQLINVGSTLFDQYFGQLDKANEWSMKDPEMVKTSPVWRPCMALVMFLKNLGLEVFGKRALWNPLCSGTIFSYLSYFGNLEVGCAMIDCQAQLRIVLHLFNALKANRIIQEGHIPFLDNLHECFEDSKAVWEGPLPKKGEFVERFWMCFGYSSGHAKLMAAKARAAVQGQRFNGRDDQKAWKPRKRNQMEPSEISKSYRRICNRGFGGVVDKYHTDEQRQSCQHTELYSFAVRTNDTLDAIDKEQKLLAFNLPTCGSILEQFVCALGDVLQWEPLLQEGSKSLGVAKRQGYAHFFAQNLLGALDFAEDPLYYEFLDVPLGLASSGFLTQFFLRLLPENAIWFNPVLIED